MAPQLLTVDQVAERLQVPCTWVYKRVQAGTIPHLKIGRYVRFEQEALTEWEAEQVQPVSY